MNTASIRKGRSRKNAEKAFYPSIVDQAREENCEAGFFNFGKAVVQGVDYFNCSITRLPDGLWLVARKSQWVNGSRFGQNSIMAFKVNEDLNPAYGVPLKLFFTQPGEHFEDPRVVVFNDAIHVSCCNFLTFNNATRWTGAHQAVFQLDLRWQPLRRFDPVFGFNQPRLGGYVGDEKNWLWFFHDQKPHLIYSAHPHVVVAFNDKFEPSDVYKTQWPSNIYKWKYGIIRGGTTPVLHDGLYWSFFHSSVPLNNMFHRRYYMGVYAFEPKPPFTVVWMISDPILAGSHMDPWCPGKPLVVFPCGALWEKDHWLVSMGVNDLACAWIKLPPFRL